jgi:NADPH:quinone reductase-like Zn-dependent oxidoreductase
MTDRPLSQRALLTCLPKNSESAWSHTLQHPVPVPSSTQILVKTSHVGLNPFDWQAVAYKLGLTEVAKVTGRDGSGVVVEVGANVKEFKVGDRVCLLIPNFALIFAE